MDKVKELLERENIIIENVLSDIALTIISFKKDTVAWNRLKSLENKLNNTLSDNKITLAAAQFGNMRSREDVEEHLQKCNEQLLKLENKRKQNDDVFYQKLETGARIDVLHWVLQAEKEGSL